MHQPPLPFRGISAAEVLQQRHAAEDGLTADEAKQRLARYGSNLLTPKKRSDPVTLLLARFKNPVTLILLHDALPDLRGDHEDGLLPEGENLTERSSVSPVRASEPRTTKRGWTCTTDTWGSATRWC